MVLVDSLLEYVPIEAHDRTIVDRCGHPSRRHSSQRPAGME